MKSNIIFMFGTLHSFQSIFTNTISIGLIWSPQSPRKYTGSVDCVSGHVCVHVNFIFSSCTEELEARRSLVSDSDNWHLSDLSDKKKIAG